VAGFDVPHVLSAAAVYSLPFGHDRRFANQGVISRVIGNWQLNGILLLRSGVPFTPSMNVDVANIGTPSTRPNLVGKAKLDNPRPEAWFNTGAFAPPAPFTFGNAGRNILRTDDFANLDLSLFREERFRERITLQFRLEAFNALNHATFGQPGANVSDPLRFGRVASAASVARQVQLGLKVLY